MKFRLYSNGAKTDQFLDIDTGAEPLKQFEEIAESIDNIEGFIFFKDNNDRGRDLYCGLIDTITNKVIKCFEFSNIYPISMSSPGLKYVPENTLIDEKVEDFKKEAFELSYMSPIKEMLGYWRSEALKEGDNTNV